jgi:hypothetical protein
MVDVGLLNSLALEEGTALSATRTRLQHKVGQ